MYVNVLETSSDLTWSYRNKLSGQGLTKHNALYKGLVISQLWDERQQTTCIISRHVNNNNFLDRL